MISAAYDPQVIADAYDRADHCGRSPAGAGPPEERIDNAQPVRRSGPRDGNSPQATTRFGGSLVSPDMDPFDRTFLPAAAEAGLPMASISRQIPIVRRCIGLGQTVLLVTRCRRLDRPLAGDHLMLLTRERLVITSESRIRHRARLHLDVEVGELADVCWEADGQLTSIEFSATAAGGARERFLIRTRKPGTVWHLDAALGYVFRPGGTRRFNSVAAATPAAWMNPVGAY